MLLCNDYMQCKTKALYVDNKYMIEANAILGHRKIIGDGLMTLTVCMLFSMVSNFSSCKIFFVRLYLNGHKYELGKLLFFLCEV